MKPKVDLRPSSDKPLDEVTLTPLFEYPNIVLYEFRSKEEWWVDVGRGTLKCWRRVTESFSADTTFVQRKEDGDGGAYKPTWNKFIKEDVKWVELSQSLGAAPVWSHRITAEMTRFTLYPVQGAVLLSVAVAGKSGGRKVYALRELVRKVRNDVEIYEEHEEDSEGEKEESKGEESDLESEGEEEEVNRKEEGDDEGVVVPSTPSPSTTTTGGPASANITNTNGKEGVETGNGKDGFAWRFIDFLREKTEAVGQIEKTQLPKYLSLPGMKLYNRRGSEWQDYGYGTVEIFKVQGKHCLRFLQKGTQKVLLLTRLASCVYQPNPTKQNAVLLSCDTQVVKGMSERVTAAFRYVPEPSASEMDRVEKDGDAGENEVDVLGDILRSRLRVSNDRAGLHAAQTFLGALVRTNAKAAV
eukprot:comp12512_c0_seq1/m.7487 comp12512_c0_seq1/g.7487  ORF comp12512_c0_seq1/g.7487 comp12512_c0_seq1/m.7487 type:complete len:413 (-) comp12512_c0_seq1:169-1407(-)